MKIAVTYDENQNVFQHFGHTEQFKIYEIENNEIISSKILSSDGEGHSALAQLLENENIDKLICGGIGGCAVNALGQAGIEIFAGISGSADEAVNALLNGTLEQTTSPNCNHHGDEEELAFGGIDALQAFIHEIGLPGTLRELGITDQSLLKTIADSCIRNDGGYRQLTHAEILDILEECY